MDALVLGGQTVVEELYEVLRALDPAHLKERAEQELREKLSDIHVRIERLKAESAALGAAQQALHERLDELSELLAVDRVKMDLDEFRAAAIPVYEQLAAALKPLDIHVPVLRPTNYGRKVFHTLNALLAVGLVEWFLSPAGMLWVSVGFAVLAVTLEVTRRVWPVWNGVLMRVLGKMAHPHEAHRVNSATWFCLALLIVGPMGDKAVAALAIGVLGVGDTAAALVGRKWGRRLLINGRTLEGTAAFFVASLLTGVGLLFAFHPEIPAQGIWLLAVCAAFVGAVVELFSRKIDDNFSITASVAIVVWGLRRFLGV